MINNVSIRNFKSIKALDFSPKKINVFLGKPNTGKSNILEALGIFSLPPKAKELKEIVRIENTSNLFYDNEISEEIKIQAGNYSCSIKFKNGNFNIVAWESEKGSMSVSFDYGGHKIGGSHSISPPFKFYRFKVLNQFQKQETNILLPPHGENLLFSVLTNKKVKEIINGLVSEYGLRVVLEPQEYKIKTQKEVNGVIISYPYSLMSDTIQRIIFYLVAIETNKDSILILEEPEAHAFPYHTKFLAEKIALDPNNNQYFISTHNPYFLLPILEKTPMEEIGVFVIYFEDFQTKLKMLSREELEEVLDLEASVFFNIDKFLE